MFGQAQFFTMTLADQEQPKKASKVGIRLLRSHHPVVTTLGEYLKLDGDITQEALLKQILVGLNIPNSPDEGNLRNESKLPTDVPERASSSGMDQCEVTMAQIVDAAQSVILWRSSQGISKLDSNKSNVLTLGCRLSNEAYPELAIPTINGPFANSLVSKYVAYDMTTNKFIIQSHFFAHLLRRIGPKRMLLLLTDTAIYYPAGNGCYFQITGQSIFELPALTQARPSPGISLTDVALAKSSLMYSRIS